ncbi:MAG: spermidine/putrescine ABC transporter substrate-binding protein, partial [Clostridia bacterium]|nr:spermidine/putrescine ABC transporter substrate-binding protein [Clostridia bacterium]
GSKTTEPAAPTAADSGETASTETAAKSDVELTVFNWYDYIDPSVIDMFEEETGITVKYANFTTNEEMFTKVEAGAGTYDVLFPSEYMVERLIANDLLAELDLNSMPNFANVKEGLKNPSYDPGNKHSVPYMWGTLGILYNTEMVDGEITSWSALFDQKNAGKVIMMNSMRDTIGLALKYLGYSMNTRDEAEINAAKDILVKQKQDKIESGYLLDETKDKMVGNEAAIAIIYSGDAQYAIEKNDKLKYVIPEEGSNIWTDSMCIPKSSQHVAEAQQFIDFMCRPDIAQMNFEYIYYCSPIQQVADGLSEEDAASATINPSEEVVARCEYFNDVSDCMELYENAWMEVRLAR